MSFTLTQYFGAGMTQQPAAAFKVNWRNARLQRIEPQMASLVGKLASALHGRAGLTLRIYNGGVHSFSLQDFDGNAIATCAAPSLWEISLRDASTSAGVWLAVQL